MFGANTTSELRGDYSRARPDFSVDQDLGSYTEADQQLWRRLYARQSGLIARYGCDEFREGLRLLDASQRIPSLEDTSRELTARTGWRIVAVPGFIPDAAFFEHLANRRFPVTVWLRKPEEFDYLVEPDLFHDFFGHVPMLLQPMFADYVQQYGVRGLEAARHDALPRLARLYWYTVEFGLIESAGGLKCFGAGMLSSGGETPYSIDSPDPHRVRFDLARVMRTKYLIDDFQKTYFVVGSLNELFRAISQDLAPVYERIKQLPDIEPDELLPGDAIVSRGEQARVAEHAHAA